MLVGTVKVGLAVEDDSGLDSRVSSRFGRAPFLAIVELEDGEIGGVRVVENPGASARSGAGIKAVQRLLEEGVRVAVAGAFGPNAMTALEELGIETVELAGVSVEEALQRIRTRLQGQ